MGIISSILRYLFGDASPQEKVSSASEVKVQQPGRVPSAEPSLQACEPATFSVTLEPNTKQISMCQAHNWFVRGIGAAVHCEVGGSPARIAGFVLSATKLIVWIRVPDGARLFDPKGQRVFLSWMDTSSGESCSTTFHITRQKGSVG